MSVAHRGDDPRGLLVKGYDGHQPPTWTDVLLVEPSPPGADVVLLVVRRRDRGEHGVEVGPELRVASARIEDVIHPGVVVEDDAGPVRRGRLGKDGPYAHENALSTASASFSDGW